MSGPWEKFAAAESQSPDDGPWAKFKPEGAAPAGPSWGQALAGAVSNIPSSFKQNIVDPILHPIDTAKGMGKLLRAGASQMAVSDPDMQATLAVQDILKPGSAEPAREAQKAEAEEGKKTIALMRKHYVDRYGSLEGFKKALRDDPVGIALDAGTLLSGGEALGLKVGTLGKVTGANKAARVAGEVGAHTLGHLTGAGPEAIRQAIKAGYERDLGFIDSLKGKLPMEQTVQMASQAVGKMRQERNAQYKAAMDAAGLDKEAIDFNKVLQSWQEAQETGHFEGVPLSARTEGLDKQVMNVLEEWYQNGQRNPKFFTAEGLDALKKKVGAIRDNIPFDKRVDRKYVGDLYSMINRQIAEQAPVYSKIMKDYAVASEGLEEIEKALSLGDKATYDTGIRKLLSAMRNNANSNYGNRLKMVDRLEEYGARGLKSRLAGAAMSSALPRGLAGRNPTLTGIAGLYDPRVLAMLPLESPNLMGRTLYGIGNLGALLEPAAGAAATATTPLWAADILKQLNADNRQD